MPRVFDNIDQHLLGALQQTIGFHIEPTFVSAILTCVDGNTWLNSLMHGRVAKEIAAVCWLECKSRPKKSFVS